MTNSLTTRREKKETPRDSGTAAISDETEQCPECGGAITEHETRGERLCEDCGLVLDDGQIDHGPEWRSFSSEEKKQRSRVGAPATELIHDKGLSTKISWQNKDAYGNHLTAEKRKQFQRLRSWDERFRTKTAHERNLKQALGEIDRMASALDLPNPCLETAAVLYRQAVENNLLPGRSIEAMTTASLYAAARRHSSPRTLDTFASVSRVERYPIQRAYRYLCEELGLTIEPTDPVQYLRQYASDLDVTNEHERLARDILETTKRQGIHSGKSPNCLAAAAIYAAARLETVHLTQQTISDVADVSVVTIRERYPELLEGYDENTE